jgi:putative transposase
MERRSFTAEFKSRVVLELLREEKSLNELAAENDIHPNVLRNWKREFLENASMVFDNKKDQQAKAKEQDYEQKIENLYKEIGQLTMSFNWLKKNLNKLFDRIGKVNLVRDQKEKAELPVSKQCELLDVNRTIVYYGFKQRPTELELLIKAHLDEMHMEDPCYGSRMLKKALNREGFHIGRKLVKRYMDGDGHLPDLSRSQPFEAQSGAQNISVFAEKPCNQKTQSSLVDRYHLYPNESWIHVFYSHNRLEFSLYYWLGTLRYP